MWPKPRGPLVLLETGFESHKRHVRYTSENKPYIKVFSTYYWLNSDFTMAEATGLSRPCQYTVRKL